MTTHQRNFIAQNPKGDFINVKVGYDGNVETNSMKTAFSEALVSQLTPVLQEIFPYTVNTRIWTLTQTDSSISFNANMAELKTDVKTTANAVMVSKKIIKYRTGMGVLTRFTALWLSLIHI